MTSSDSPRPRRTPEDEGLPDHADDTSTAFDEADRPRFNDSPYPLPQDAPQGLEEYGITAAEQQQGEPLDDRLDREEPEVAVDAPWPGSSTDLDADESGDPVGRLVEPDEGVRPDTDAELYASGSPTVDGGLSAEESAVHQLTEDDLERAEDDSRRQR